MNSRSRRELLLGSAAGLLGLSAACSGGGTPSPSPDPTATPLPTPSPSTGPTPTPQPPPRSVAGRILTVIYGALDPSSPESFGEHTLALRPDGTERYIFLNAAIQCASPDGIHLVFNGPDDQGVLNLETGVRIALPPGLYVTPDSYSPDGRHLYAYKPLSDNSGVLSPAEVWLFNADGQLIRKLYTGARAPSATVIPGWLGSSHLYLALQEGTYQLGLDGVLGEQLPVRAAQFASPDGRYLGGVLYPQGTTVEIVELSSGAARTFETGLEFAFPYFWSRNGRFVFLSGRRAGAAEVIRIESTSGSLVRIPGGSAGASMVVPSPDGESFATSLPTGEAPPPHDLIVYNGPNATTFREGGQPIAWL